MQVRPAKPSQLLVCLVTEHPLGCVECVKDKPAYHAAGGRSSTEQKLHTVLRTNGHTAALTRCTGGLKVRGG